MERQAQRPISPNIGCKKKEPSTSSSSPVCNNNLEIEAIQKFGDNVSSLVENIQALITRNGIKDFIAKDVGKALPIFNIYMELLQTINVKDFNSLYERLKQLSLKQRQNPATATKTEIEKAEFVKDIIESFFKAEELWDNLLAAIDSKMNSCQLDIYNANSVDTEEEIIVETLDEQKIPFKSITSTKKWTWAIFLRHFA